MTENAQPAAKSTQENLPTAGADDDLFSFRWTEDGLLHITQKGEDAMALTFGSGSETVNNGLMAQCLNVLDRHECVEGSRDARAFLPAIIKEIGPQDAFERMLAVQMAITHIAMVRSGRRFANADHLHQYEAHERAFNKLARTYTTQMEALRKHRNGGRQTVTVQHVNVEGGAQAIVGNIQTGGGPNER